MSEKKITTVDVASDVTSGATLYIEENGTFRRANESQVKEILGIKNLEEKTENLEKNMVDKSVLYDVLHNTPHIETIGDYFDLKRTGKIYRTRIWLFSKNPISSGTKLLDNAGLEFSPSTDTVEGRDDYLNGENPLFEWMNCNYKRNDDGSPYPTALEGDENYRTTGAVDVGTIQMSFYYNVETNLDEGYMDFTVSDSRHALRTDVILYPWTECKTADNQVLQWCIGSKYYATLGDDGVLRSVKNAKPELWISHNKMVSEFQKKGKGYHGAGAEHMAFQYIFNIIKGATKNSQDIFMGCTNYNYQYSASIIRSEKEVYFPVTNSQANNLVVGSSVSVGYGQLNDAKTGVNLDRGVTNLHKYAKVVRILKIEALDANNKAVYLDVDTGFDTTPVALSDSVTANITLSTMPWYSGTTDVVIGKHDGSPVSNTSGKYPYRVQGREYRNGAYEIASDTVMFFQSDYSKDVYVCPKGVARSTSDSVIKQTYTKVGNIPASKDGKGADYWIGDISIDVSTGAWYPSSIGSSSSQGVGSILYAGGANTSGSREFLVGGNLWSGRDAGFLVNCGGWLDGAYWFCGCRD